MRFRITLLAAVLLGSSPCLAAPQEPATEAAAVADLQLHSYKLAKGDTIHASLLEHKGDRVRMRVSIAGGAASTWYDVTAFDDASQVRLRRELVPDGDIVGQLGVAEFAREKGLVQQCRLELRRAVYMTGTIPPEQGEAVRERALDVTVWLIEEYSKQGKVAEARAGVRRLLTRKGDKLTEEQKMRLLDAVDAGAVAKEARVVDAAASKKAAQLDAKITKDLAKIEKHVEQGRELRRKGLLNSRKSGMATKAFQQAVKHFEAADKQIATMQKKYANEPVVLGELEEMGAVALAGWKDSLLAESSLYLTKGSFNRAMEGTNRVLARIPEDPQAMQMRARIEVAANDWGW